MAGKLRQIAFRGSSPWPRSHLEPKAAAASCRVTARPRQAVFRVSPGPSLQTLVLQLLSGSTGHLYLHLFYCMFKIPYQGAC